MKKEFIVNRQGKEFVLYAGLLDQAHREGLKRITTKLLQSPSDENGQMAISWAEVETEKGIFSGIGDASPGNVGRMIATHTIRMSECVPLSAKILTRNGWRYHDELSLGEEVLAYDAVGDLCRWTPLLLVTVYPEPMPTIRLRSRSFDATCTPLHTWAVTNQGSRVRLRHAESFAPGDSIVLAARAEGSSCPLTPREASLLGWLATDGWISTRKVTVGGRQYGPYTRAVIAQSKEPYVTEIAALMGADGSHQHAAARTRDFGTYVSQCLPQSKFELTTGFTRELLAKAGWTCWEDLPQIVTTLSQDARAAMLDAMLKGDGTQVRSGDTWVFGQKAKPGVMEAFIILATLEGRALGIPRTASVGDVPVRTVRSNRRVSTAYLEATEGQAQPVWCPTTAYGTWVMMNEEGTVCITGNTRAKARALRDAINVGVTALEELADVEEDSGEVTRLAGPRPAPRTGSAAPSTVEPEQAEPLAAEARAASPDRLPAGAATPATQQQIDRLRKLQAALGRPTMLAATLTSEEAAAQIGELVRTFNAQSRSPRSQVR